MADPCRPVAEWPDLLLGPMVRLLTRDSVSIFIATSIECSAQLALRSGWRMHTEIDDTHFAPNPVIQLDRIGARLWVGLLPASLPAGSEGQTFSYDVKLLPPEPGLARRLYPLGELGTEEGDSLAATSLDPLLDVVPLGYEAGRLPSFVVPPAHAIDLRLAHASCRKPHGGVEGEPDALTILDHVIALDLGVLPALPATTDQGVALPEAPPMSNRERPHQLILTGDQIYADDVAAGLLAAITAAGTELMGWEEVTPGVYPPTRFMTAPGWRSRFLGLADFVEVPSTGDTDYSANHLLTFAEWCAMYLFAWSDALWARSEDRQSVELLEPADRVYASELADFTAWVSTFTNNVVPANYERLIGWLGRVDKFAKNVHDVWEETRDQAMRFGSTVRRVRRLLANVSTLTMFDDHDVTDDWFLNRAVTDKMLGLDAFDEMRRLGPRLIRNALSAYAIFQHWGNVPGDFGMAAPHDVREFDAAGVLLLDMWEPQPPDDPQALVSPPLLGHEPDDPATVEVDEDDTRRADALLGIDVQPSLVPPAGTDRQDFDRMRWDYAIDFGCYRLIALDTRTWRFFPGRDSVPWPSTTPVVEERPSDTASRRFLDDVTQAWTNMEATVEDVQLNRFVSLLAGVQDAAKAVVQEDVQAHLNDVATLTRELIDALWPGDSAAEGVDVIEAYVESVSDDGSREDALWHGGLLLNKLAEIPVEVHLEPLSRALQSLGGYLEAEATGTTLQLVLSVKRLVADLNDDLVAVFVDDALFQSSVAEAVGVALPSLAAALQAIEPDGWSTAFFRDGTNELGAGLVSKDALQFQLVDVIAGDVVIPLESRPPTVLLSPAPIFGNTLVEVVQRAGLVSTTMLGGPGAVEWDYEAWNVNGPAMNDLFEAAAGLDRCVVLSGDVHYANSSLNDVRLGDVATRYAQFTSSSSRNADFKTTKFGLLDDLLWTDIGQSTITQMALSRLAQNEQAPAGVKQDGPSLGGWARERIAEMVGDTFSIETFQEWVEDMKERFPSNPLEVLRWQVTAPLNSTKAWAAEVAYSAYRMIRLAEELHDDWQETLFGDYLTARDVLRQQMIDLYRECGVDQAYGYEIRRTMLRDLRPVRLDLYKARQRFHKYGRSSNITQYANVQEVQTVGSSNVGLVRFKADGAAITGVSHELLWYPKPETEKKIRPAGRVINAVLRDDWMGTLHELGWTGSAHRSYPPQSSVPPVVS
jgi:hypothetical protein